jgi:hypothetical protein
VHLRAERDGACSPIGRVYTMRMVAVDVCGNSTASNPFDVGVWNDRNSPPLSGSIRQAANGSGTYDTRPGLNGTYSAGCGVGGASVNGTVADHSDVDPEAEISQSASIGVGDLRLVKSTGATILLTWTEPAHAATINVTRFHVYRLDPATLFWTQLAELPKQTTSYLDPGLSDGNDRQYKVTAVIK